MSTAIVTAVITASVAVVIAVANSRSTWRLARSERRYERMRSALLDVQDAALEVRRLLRAYGGELGSSLVPASTSPDAAVAATPPPQPLSSPEMDHATGRLEVRAVRLGETQLSRAVGTAVELWRTSAVEHFIGQSDEPRSAEQQRWTELNLAVKAALAA